MVHAKGLWSAGPNEEWGGDGHMKLYDEMGLSIWGLVDKASRRELGLYAVSGTLNADITVALYLLTVKKCKVSNSSYFSLRLLLIIAYPD
jgi:hypothetical protein